MERSDVDIDVSNRFSYANIIDVGFYPDCMHPMIVLYIDALLSDFKGYVAQTPSTLISNGK